MLRVTFPPFILLRCNHFGALTRRRPPTRVEPRRERMGRDLKSQQWGRMGRAEPFLLSMAMNCLFFVSEKILAIKQRPRTLRWREGKAGHSDNPEQISSHSSSSLIQSNGAREAFSLCAFFFVFLFALRPTRD
jgi:hypothetical protein